MRRVSRDPAELRKALKKGKGKLDGQAGYGGRTLQWAEAGRGEKGGKPCVR